MEGSTKGKTKILVLGTLHKFHRVNKAYTYDDVFKIIDNFHPEVLGVEIRPEDINQPREYLEKYYPYEMVEALFRYSKQIDVCGFDYYEKSLEGKLIPEGYFNNFHISEMENKLEGDSLLAKERQALDICGNMRMQIVNSNPTAPNLNDGRYDIVSDIYYKQMKLLLNNTSYEALADFYIERDRNIDKNIVNIIEKNIGRKCAFIMGTDHRVFAVNAIKEKFGEDVEIVRVK
jgi:hypothetical protein